MPSERTGKLASPQTVTMVKWVTKNKTVWRWSEGTEQEEETALWTDNVYTKSGPRWWRRSSPSKIASRSIHVVTNDRTASSLPPNRIPLSRETTSSLSIHLWVDTCFHVSAPMNNATMDMREQVTLWDANVNSFGCKPRCGGAGSQGSSIFNCWRDPLYCFP